MPEICLPSLVDKHLLEELANSPLVPPSLYQSRTEAPGLIIYHLVTKDDLQGMSLSIMDIGEETALHYHKRMVEIFVGVRGETEIVIEEKPHLLTSGAVIMIPPQAKHKVKGLGPQGSRVLYISFPAWAPEEVQIINDA